MILFLLFLLTAQVYAQTYCQWDNSACMYSSDNGTDAIITVLVREERIKWVGIGFGKGMLRAECYILWRENSQEFTISRRASTQRSEPKTVSIQPQNLLNDEEFTNDFGNGTWYVSFTRPKQAIEAGGVQVDITASIQPMIFAVGTSVTGTGLSASINRHYEAESFEANLYASASAFNATQVANLPPRTVAKSDPRYTIIIHGILMFVAWQVMCPFGIAIARFLKPRMVSWWFKGHVLSMLAVIALSVAGLIMAFSVIDSHFNPSMYSSGGSHVILGLIIVILALFQLVSGLIIHKLYNADRTATPWWDKVHWWTGRLVYLFAVINIPLGFHLFYVVYEEQVSIAIWVIYFVYTAILWTIFIFVSRGQHKKVSSQEFQPE